MLKLSGHLLLGGALAAAAVAISSGVEQRPPAQGRAAVSPVLRLDLSRTTTANEPGCNSTAFAQLPGDPALFIGRQSVTADGRLAGVTGANDCSGGNVENERVGRPYNRWGLVLDAFDWNSRQFTVVKPLIDTSFDPRTGQSRAVITGGPMRGLIVRSAYDPSVVEFAGQLFVAFECTLENRSKRQVHETSSCIAVYDPRNRSVNMSKVTVAVAGQLIGDAYTVASVPRLMAFAGKLYLYWAASVIRNGKIVRSAARGAELDVRDGIPHVIGSPTPSSTPLGPGTTEVWSTDATPTGNLIANVMSLVPSRDSFMIFGVLGGGDCQTPAGSSPGCFRLAVRNATEPLRPSGFNLARAGADQLPTNAHEYPTPIVDRAGNRWILGHFRRPTGDGYSSRAPAPGKSFWASSKRESVLALIPARIEGIDPTRP